MKKLYALKTDTNTKSIKLVVFAVLLISTIFKGYGQVRVPFAPRSAVASPLKTVYNIKGDFTMVGNTNLTLVNYSNTGDNASDMKFVDIDGDSNTWNSSSATLSFSTENGAIPACSQIIYAGLYWTGRASDNSTNPHTFSITKNGVTKNFDKRKVLLKGPGGFYEEVLSNTTSNINKNIYFPDNATDLGMYSSYAEVTEYVQAHGIGEYFVADMALREGPTSSAIGLYGGWGMVVVYENSKMKYRNVTVFDGHAFVGSSITANYSFDVAGFNAVQSGNVNIKLGLMAGEGDERYTGDYFEIQRQDNGLYQRLSHSTTTTGNFFNSSINTGGNTRNPNFQNNTGLDIAMFNVPNPSNGIITNNQTSTRFRYGSTVDTYCIFNVTFSVDAYIPDTEGVLSTTSINGDPNPSTQSLEPGQTAGYKIEIRNKGTEATNNTVITIPVPDNVNTSNLNIVSNVYAPLTTTNVPVINPSNATYPNGYITWNLGTLPVPTNPDTVLADISFSLTVTTDCSALLDPSFDPNIALYGSIKGTGAISNINFDKNLILGYQTTGLCTGEPIPIPSLVAINYLNYTNQPPTASNPIPINVQCKADVPVPDVLVVTDEADNSGIAPIVAFVSDVSDNGVNPEIITRTYSVTDDCGNSINAQQTITINDTQLPTITCPTDITVNPDAGQSTASGVNLGTPTTSDNCLVEPATNNAPATFPIGDTIVIWTVRDAAGNEATCNQTVTVTDNEPPVIVCPGDIAQNVDAGQNGAIVTYTAPVGTDNSSGATTSQTAGLPSGSLFPVGITINTFVVTDIAGNTATCSFTVTITDNEPPVIVCPADIAQNVDAGVAGAVVTFSNPVGTDNATGAVTTQIAGPASGSTFPIGITTVTFQVEDASGNIVTCSFTVTITDNEPPVIVCPADIAQNVDAGVASAVVTFSDPVGTDNATGAVTTQIAGPASGSTFPIGITTVTFQVEDASGNIVTCSFTVTITDNEPPVIVCPADIAQNVDAGVAGAVVTFSDPVGTDNATGAITTRIAGPASGSTFPIGITTVTFQVEDASGNFVTCSFTVTITDNEPPVIVCPADIAQNVDAGVAGAVVNYTDPVGTDNATGAVTTQIAGPASGSTFPIGITTVTFQVEDASGNIVTCSFTVTITDNEPPVIVCPADIAQNVDAGVAGAVVTFSDPVGTDNATGAVTTQIAGPASGSTFPIGITTVTFQVEDASGNIVTCSFNVTITDNEPPVIVCPGDIAQNVDAGQNGAIVTYTAPVGTDNSSGATTSQTAGLPSGSLFPVGITINTFVVTDIAGNSATCSFTVTITDNEPPVIVCPADITQNVDAGMAGAVVTFSDPVGTDNATGAVTTQIAGPASGSTFPIGITTVTFQVEDASGNIVTCSFTVTITDNEPPVIVCPADIAQNVDAGVAGAVVTFSDPVGTDNATGAVTTQIAGPASGSTFPIGITTVTFQVEDASGNIVTCSFTVTITDNEPPVIVCPADITQNVDAGVAGAVVNYTDPVGTDNATGAVTTQIAGPASGSTFPIGITTVTFQVEDASGNIVTCSFTVTITDNEPPVIVCPADIAQNVDAGVAGAVVNYTDPVGTDNATGAVTTQIAGPASGSTFPIGITTVTFQVEDASGNIVTCSFTVTITDNEPPVIVCPADIAQNVDAGVAGAVVTFSDPVGTDNATGAVTTQIAGPASGSTFPIGITTVTFQVEDASGNIVTCSFTVTITDNEPPVIVCPADIAQNVDAGVAGAVVNYSDPVGTDNATGAITTRIAGPASGSTFPIGITTVTFQVEDASGNFVTCSFTVTITDNENPSIVCLPPVIQNVDLGICGAIVTYTTPVGTDNSTGAITTQTDGLSSGALFPVGITTNTFVVTDATGNTATCSFIVTVVDNELPIITCPIDINQSADSGICGAAISIVNPTATDNCSSSFTFIGTRSDNLALTDIYPVGTTTISWTAIDEANNVSLPCTQTINVTDNESPTFVEALPADINVECDQVPIAAILTSIDNCNSAIVIFDEVITTGSCVSNYILTRTWTATDSSGNTTLHTQIVTVKDTTSPVLTLPANVSAECSDDLTPIAFGTATATDNCDDNPIVTYNDVTTNGACLGTFTITRTWTATDVCGNVSTADQIISTSDTTAPEFVETTLPQDITIECSAIQVAETLTATDNCGTATVTVNDVRTNGSCNNNYIVTRTWTATDECGLTNTHVQIITVQDTIPPTFVETLPPTNLVVECDAVPTAATLTATDICGSATVTVNDVRTNGNCPNNYTLARTWTATDECGLKTSHTQIIVVRDTKAPKFVETLPRDLTVECDAVPNTQTLTATDNCGSATVTVNDAITIGNCPSNYIIVRTYTATDECGLKTTHTQIITVQDTKAPVTTTTFDAVLNVSCTNIPDVPVLTFKDNCSSNIKVVYNETNTFADNVYLDYEIVRTWTVTDECNNEAIFTQTLNVALDEVVTDIVAPDRCYDDGIVNLSDLISSDLNKDGTWALLEGDPTATLTGSIFNPTVLQLSKDFLPDDGGIDYKFRYTTTDKGCISITEMTMNINADCVVLPCGENDVIISKAVTPNGDSYNEFFEISGIELCGFRYDVKIFNRWGALIYESNDYQNNWNGTASKSSIGAAGKVPNGTYYYIVTLKDSGLRPFTGPVYLGTK